MTKHKFKTAATLLTVGAVIAFSLQAFAKEPATDKVKAQIMTKLHAIEAALARGDTAEQIARSMYADSLLMTGEGEKGSSRGMDDAIRDVQGWMDSLGPNGTKGCKYSIPDPVVASARTFTSFVVLVCKANPPVLPADQELRMIYSWTKGPTGWRVVLEMWGSGVM
jgi:hypothetical protein